MIHSPSISNDHTIFILLQFPFRDPTTHTALLSKRWSPHLDLAENPHTVLHLTLAVSLAISLNHPGIYFCCLSQHRSALNGRSCALSINNITRRPFTEASLHWLETGLPSWSSHSESPCISYYPLLVNQATKVLWPRSALRSQLISTISLWT